MRVVFVGQSFNVVAGNDEATACKLDAGAGAGGIPGPVWLFAVGCNVSCRAPTLAVVLAVGQPYRARARAAAIDYLALDVGA